MNNYFPQIYSPNLVVNYSNEANPSDYYLQVYNSNNNEVSGLKLMYLPDSAQGVFEDRNLIKNPSFENQTLWGVVGDVTPHMPGEANFSAIQSTDATDGNYSLRLSTNNHTPAEFAEVENFYVGSTYRLSFDYKYVSGAAPRFAVFQPGYGLANPALELNKSKTWQHFETTFHPDVNSTGLVLFLYADPIPGGETVVLYDNVVVNKAKLAVINEVFNAPELVFNHVNPTKYVVNVTAASIPYYLVMSESF